MIRQSISTSQGIDRRLFSAELKLSESNIVSSPDVNLIAHSCLPHLGEFRPEIRFVPLSDSSTRSSINIISRHSFFFSRYIARSSNGSSTSHHYHSPVSGGHHRSPVSGGGRQAAQVQQARIRVGL